MVRALKSEAERLEEEMKDRDKTGLRAESVRF